MRKILPAFLLLGLTACPQPQTPVVNVPADPAVLNGTWQGTLTLRSDQAAVRGTDAAYRQIIETDLAGQSVHSLLAQRLGSGEVLKQLRLLLPIEALAYRAATPNTPARLLLYHRAALSGGVLLHVMDELDPVTLETKASWEYNATAPLPSGPYATFNLDGTEFAGADGSIVSTLTHELLPLHASIKTLIANPPRPNGMVNWSPDMNWLTVSTYVPALTGGEYRYDFISNANGQKISGAPLHSVGCNLTGTQASWSSHIVSLPGGGVALSFPDGVIELRKADGSLRQAVNLGECGFQSFTGVGDHLTVLSQTGKTSSIRVSDGAVQTSVSDIPKLPSLQVTLNTQAKYLTETTYESSGTATVNGQAYAFKATATAHNMKFKAQTSQIIPEVLWTGELRRPDGTLYATAYGGHNTTPDKQGLNLKLADVNVSFDYGGMLTR